MRNFVKAWRALVVVSVVVGVAMPLRAATLVLTTQTSNWRDAGTDDDMYFALYFIDKQEAPTSGGAKPRAALAMKRVDFTLDNEGNDREAGAADTYRLEFDFPSEMLRRVEIGSRGGEDAWRLKGFRYVVEDGGRTSRPTEIAVGAWVSGQRKDGGKKSDSKQYYYFDVKPPVFSKGE